MTDEVVYGPTKPPTTDWRWQEVLNMEPFEVMAELQELDSNLFAARSEFKEAARELKELEERLHRAKQETLAAVLAPDLKDRLFKGGTKDERKERQEMYLVDQDWVKRLVVEIKTVRERKDNAQVAFDSLLDRQTNLGRFANMYAATTRLLASIQVSAPLDQELAEHLANLKRMDPKALRVAFDELAAQLFPAGSSSSISGPSDSPRADVIFQFAERAKEEIMPPSLRDLCADVRSWMEWHKNPVGSPPVDTVGLVDRVVVAGVEKRKVAEDAAKTAAERDEVEIPTGMGGDAEAITAAIERYRGEAPGNPCPKCGHDLVQNPVFGLLCMGCGPVKEDEELPFQPDEAISL